MKDVSHQHYSVMRNECLELLSPAIEKKEHPVVVDATLGLGGHTYALLERFPHLTVIGIDRDEVALARASKRLEQFGNRFIAVHAAFDEIESIVHHAGFTSIDGALFDLGVSSIQLDESERGFSYSTDAPLDMRMDKSQQLTAAEIVNTYEPRDLVHILRSYGEEKFAPAIVTNIVKARTQGYLNSTAALVEIIKKSIPAPARRTGGNPAKRTFQALRIETNNELGLIKVAIPAALALIAVGARIVVMSFQSLEDRIVKEIFVEACTSKSPAKLPVELAQYRAKFAMVTKGALTPTDEELAVNPRSQSVRLRAIERVVA